MNKLAIAFVTVTLAFAMGGCYDDEFGAKSYNDGHYRVSATMKYFDEGSRAIFDESKFVINNYCLLVFNKKAKDGLLLHIEDLDLTSAQTVTLPVTESLVNGTNYFAMLLGNVTSAQLIEKGLVVEQSTLDKMYDISNNITANYNNPNESSNIANFTWSASLEIGNDTKDLNFQIHPNLAKVIVNVTNSSSGSGTTLLTNVQVRNVVNKVRLAQNALSDGNLFGSSENKGSVVIDYDIESCEVKSGGGKATFSWYVPANVCGEGVRGANLSLPAEQSPTFIEITGVRGVDHLTAGFRIYLGEKGNAADYNAMTNFDVLPDKIYNVTIDITKNGLTYNVTNKYNEVTTNAVTGLVKLPYNANCHMINPNFSKVTTGYPVYELPIDRIDECWGASGQIPDASMRIGSDEEWTMEVIWQDINKQVIQFCDKDGKNGVNTYSGKGYEPAYFKIVPTTVDASCYGNILVGVKKKGSSDYLWSWHLWVTDYNPDVAPAHSAGTYIRESTGVNGINGAVHHYYHTQSLYWGTSKFLSGAIWNSGIYKNAWIMDRNLGAIATNTTINTTKTYGLYYQWGSKNPFPHASYKFINSSGTTSNGAANGGNSLKGLYTINGSTTTFTVDESANWGVSVKTVQDVTKKPNVFYGVSGDQLYVDSYSGLNNIWASPKPITTSDKSIFDPCPPGWTVPVYDIMDFMTISAGNTEHSPDEVSGWQSWYNSSSRYGTDCCTFTVFRESDDATKYGQKDFALGAIVYKDGAGTSNVYYAEFPIQGVLTAYNDGISSTQMSYFWFSEPSIISGNTNQGDATAIFSYTGSTANASRETTPNATYREKEGKWRTQYIQDLYTYDNKGNILYSTWNGLKYYDVWNGRMCRLSLIKSRGHNVRCIQTPNKETLKYH